MAGDATPDTSFNLSRWAIEHPQRHPLSPRHRGDRRRARPHEHRPEGRPRLHLPRHGRPGDVAGRVAHRHAGPGRQQDRAEAPGDAAPRFRALLHACRQRHHHGPDQGRHLRPRRDRRLLPGAQEGRRHRQRAAERHLWAVLQRRVRRHLHHPPRDHRRRLLLPRAQVVRDRRARRAAAASPASRRSSSSATRRRSSTSTSHRRCSPSAASRCSTSRMRSPARTTWLRPAASRRARVRSASPSAATSSAPRTSSELRLKLGGQVVRLGDIADRQPRSRRPIQRASTASTARTRSKSASSWRRASTSPPSARTSTRH